MSSLQGHLLIASSRLYDPNFFRSVVLLARHGDEGAFGLVLNRPSGTAVSEVWKRVSTSPCRYQGALHVGGPCEGPLIALHASELLADISIMPGVYLSSEPSKLEQLLAHPEEPLRFFAGYAGWGEGQLEGELKEDSWLVLPARSEHIFAPGEDIWTAVTKEFADAALLKTLKIKHAPKDPRLN